METANEELQGLLTSLMYVKILRNYRKATKYNSKAMAGLQPDGSSKKRNKY